jgi:hypothetical protein
MNIQALVFFVVTQYSDVVQIYRRPKNMKKKEILSLSRSWKPHIQILKERKEESSL